METYRLYSIDKNNHFDGVTVVECASDEAAMAAAASLNLLCPIEVWHRARRVGLLNCMLAYEQAAD